MASHVAIELPFLQEPSLSDAPGGHSHLSDSHYPALCHGPPLVSGMGQEYEVFIMAKRSERIKEGQEMGAPDCSWNTAKRKSSRLADAAFMI